MAVTTFDLQLDQYTDFTRTAIVPTGLLRYPLTNGSGMRLMVRANAGDLTSLVSLTTTSTANGQLVFMPLGNPLALQVIITKVGNALILPIGTQLNYDWLIDWNDGTTDDFSTGRVFVKPGSTH
jgi:hypothetical protein